MSRKSIPFSARLTNRGTYWTHKATSFAYCLCGWGFKWSSGQVMKICPVCERTYEKFDRTVHPLGPGE